MSDREHIICFRGIMAGNLFLWLSSMVVFGLSVGALTYDVDSWLPFDYKPVLETHKVATASVTVSVFCLHLASLGWLALGFRKRWQIRTYMIGNVVSAMLQLAVGVGVLVINKRAWPYFQLISLHLCFERFSRQRSRRVTRSLDTTNDTTEGWLPTGPPESHDSQDYHVFFGSLRTLPMRPGPAVPSDCLPKDLLTAAGSLLVIAAFVSVFLAFFSSRLLRHQRNDVIVSRRNTFNIGENPRVLEFVVGGQPEKPPRHAAPKTQEEENAKDEDLPS